MGGRGNALDHENRKTPINKPAANAQRVGGTNCIAAKFHTCIAPFQFVSAARHKLNLLITESPSAAAGDWTSFAPA